MERLDAAVPAPEAGAEAKQSNSTAAVGLRVDGRRPQTRPRRRRAAAAAACSAGALASGDEPACSAGTSARPPTLEYSALGPGPNEVASAAECGAFDPWGSPAGRGAGPASSANIPGQDRTGAPLRSASPPGHGHAGAQPRDASPPGEMMALRPWTEPRLDSTGAPGYGGARARAVP